MTTNMDAVSSQLRERARQYPPHSPECEAFLVALVRHVHAEQDARVDAAIMRSWRICRGGS